MSGNTIVLGSFSPAFYDRLDRKISEDVAERAQQLAADMCQTFDQYRYATGFIAGLHRAQELMDDLKTEIQEGR